MSEQNEYSYAKTLQNTINQTMILRMAHNVMQSNKSKPDVVKRNILNIRTMINEAKLKAELKNTNRRHTLIARFSNGVGA